MDADYLGRTYMEPPSELKFETPEKCFIPKKCIHTWYAEFCPRSLLTRGRTGHTKGVSAIRFIPKTAHLLLSAGLDSKVKLWEVHGRRRCLRTYMGEQINGPSAY